MSDAAVEQRREKDRIRQQRHRDRQRLLNTSQDAMPTRQDASSGPINTLPDSQFTCLGCGATVGADEWLCPLGLRHVVPGKTYLLADAPAQAARDDRGNWLPKTGRTLVTNIPPGRAASEVPAGSDDWAYGGGCVTFENGRYVTSDPVEQYWLDKKGGFCTEAQWEAAWMSPSELEQKRHEKQERELREEAQRLNKLSREIRRLKGQTHVTSPGEQVEGSEDSCSICI